MLIQDADLDAFCLDCFPEVKKRFTDGMDRVKKVTLLLELTDFETLLASLKRVHPDAVARHETVLVYEEVPRPDYRYEYKAELGERLELLYRRRDDR